MPEQAITDNDAEDIFTDEDAPQGGAADEFAEHDPGERPSAPTDAASDSADADGVELETLRRHKQRCDALAGKILELQAEMEKHQGVVRSLKKLIEAKQEELVEHSRAPLQGTIFDQLGPDDGGEPDDGHLTPYELGMQAAERGLRSDACPYPSDDDRREKWLQGHAENQPESTAADDELPASQLVGSWTSAQLIMAYDGLASAVQQCAYTRQLPAISEGLVVLTEYDQSLVVVDVDETASEAILAPLYRMDEYRSSCGDDAQEPWDARSSCAEDMPMLINGGIVARVGRSHFVIAAANSHLRLRLADLQADD